MQTDIALGVASIIALGIFAQWMAWKIRWPAIVLLTATGLLIGPGLGLLKPSEALGAGLQPLIGLCVAVILFEGGLNLRLHELREAGTVVRRLTSISVVVTWVLGIAVAHYIGGLAWPVATVFAAILVVTGPTVILPLLRHAGLNKRTASYLKWEGIINDPIGVLLAVLVFEYLLHMGDGNAWLAPLGGLGKAIGIAIVAGGGVGYLLGRLFRASVIPEYLKSPAVIASVLLAFSVSNVVQHEAGLLTVTVMGIVMGNMNLRSIEEMRRFKEYLTILLVSTVFIVLSAELEWADLKQLTWTAPLLVFGFLFIVRPASVWISTIGAKADWRDRLLVGWVAPRGVVAAATAGAFAIPLTEAGFEDAELLVPLTFSMILATVLIHGFTLGPLARRLGLATAQRRGLLLVGSTPWTVALAKTLRELDQDVLIADTSWHRLRPARHGGLPVFYGEILSDRAEEALELNSIASVLAATSNDAYNALICTSFAPELGRQQVFQLPTSADDDDPRGVAKARRGLTALSEELSFETLWSRQIKGWAFKKTKLSDEYTFAQLKEDLGEDGVPVMLIRAAGSLVAFGPQSNPKAAAGDTVISYIPPGAPETEPVPEPAVAPS